MENSNRLVYGWGINDADYNVVISGYLDGKRKNIWVCPIYKDWCSILERCFSVKTQNKQPTYKDCTICNEWKYFSNFRRWVLEEQPNKDWQNCEPDKDFLGSNKYYSPETCVYIPKKLNLFITNSKKTRGIYMIGVTFGNKVKSFKSLCRNPFTGKQDCLGVFSTELEAHLAWQAKKHEHALRLADEQQDHRIAKVLQERYAPDKDWTNK